MRLALAHVRAGTIELARYPAFAVPTLAFPALLFLLFGVPFADRYDPEIIMAGFAATALLGVCFFQFGVGIAAERANPWESFLRTLPVTPTVRLAARVGSALLFATASGSLVVAVALAATDVSLTASRWAAFAAALLLGAVPMAILGIALGYWLPPKAALPVANVLFLPLALAGGFWSAGRLPEGVGSISAVLPTRHWGDLLWSAVEGTAVPLESVLALAGFGLAFALFAVWGYRRDEGERFH